MVRRTLFTPKGSCGSCRQRPQPTHPNPKASSASSSPFLVLCSRCLFFRFAEARFSRFRGVGSTKSLSNMALLERFFILRFACADEIEPESPDVLMPIDLVIVVLYCVGGANTRNNTYCQRVPYSRRSTLDSSIVRLPSLEIKIAKLHWSGLGLPLRRPSNARIRNQGRPARNSLYRPARTVGSRHLTCAPFILERMQRSRVLSFGEAPNVIPDPK